MPEEHPEHSRAQECPDTLHRGDSASLSVPWWNRSFLWRLKLLVCQITKKKEAFLTSDILLEKEKFSLAALIRDHNS